MVKQKTRQDLSFTIFRDSSLPEYVKEFVEIKGQNIKTTVRLFPRNTPEILINLGKPIQGEGGNQAVTIKNCTIQGSKTGYVKARHPKKCHFLSIRFTPNGFYKAYGESQKQFTDHIYNLDDLTGHKANGLIPSLRKESTPQKRFQILIDWVNKSMNKREMPSELLSDFIIDQFNLNPYLSVNQLVDRTGYTRKHLAHRFKEEAGLTIKEYQKINRLKLLLKNIYRKPDVSWPNQVYAHGYYDQSHLIKEFKKYTGYTPTDYLSHQYWK